jgi:hypothetical protein
MEKRRKEPGGYDKEVSKPQYYPTTNILPRPVPPPVLPLHIPVHPSLTKGIAWEDFDILPDNLPYLQGWMICLPTGSSYNSRYI